MTYYILASFPDRVTERGILNVGLSDNQLIYCTWKITRIKWGGHKEIKFRSFNSFMHNVAKWQNILKDF